MNKPVAFKDLKDDELFVFAREPFFPGMKPGPWIKASSRTYYHLDDRSFPYRVGSIHVRVIPIPSVPERPSIGSLEIGRR